MELQTKFLESKYSSKTTVCEFLDGLRVEREKLASVGVDIDEKDYRSTIISSLPYALANFASSQLASARLYAPTKTIHPDSLISLIAEESDRQKTQQSRWQGSRSKDDDKDKAMYVSPGSSKGKDGKGKRKTRGVCWNCNEEGHYSNKCPKPKREKKKGDSAKGKGSANTAVESDSESEGAFMMEPDLESILDDIPDLLSVTSSSDTDGENLNNPDLEDGDWFSEIEDDETDEEGSALINESTPGETPTRAEVYDSGCTTTITPY
jgi:hypothetical protein